MNVIHVRYHLASLEEDIDMIKVNIVILVLSTTLISYNLQSNNRSSTNDPKPKKVNMQEGIILENSKDSTTGGIGILSSPRKRSSRLELNANAIKVPQ